MQKVIVLNREQAIRLTETDFSIDRVIISISSLWDNPPEFNKNNYSIRSVCNLFFDDEEQGPNVITEADASKIKEFLTKWYNKVDQIVVHCDAGVSRSAGVAAAILKYYTGDDTQIFDDLKYCPNMLCYRTVLNKLMENTNNQ